MEPQTRKSDKLRVLTSDGRLLTLLRIGTLNSEHGTNNITCLDQNKNEVDITFQDVERVYGVYNFFNYKKGVLG